MTTNLDRPGDSAQYCSPAVLGVDSLLPVTTNAIIQARNILGTQPVYWGRYFTSPETTALGEYRHAIENGPLAQAGIRVLPIARQTDRVGGPEAWGTADGAANAQDIIDSFGAEWLISQSSQLFVFLDVEMPGANPPALSEAYLTGWAAALQKTAKAVGVCLQPCLYSSLANAGAWKIVQQSGVCPYVWVASYVQDGISIPAWDPAHAIPPDLTCPTLLWQFAGDIAGAIDLNLSRPGSEELLLPGLILPPMS